MIKCSGECPNDKGNTCCFNCELKLECNDACASNPEDCNESVQVDEETAVSTFETKQATTIKTIAEICTAKKKLEEQEKQLKEQLLKAMETNNVKSFNNDVLKITYVAATTTNSVDSKKLKKKYPNIAAECSKTSNKSAYVKVEVK